MSGSRPSPGARLVVVGDALLDRDLDGRAERLCPDAPAPVLDDVVANERPGGAGLAATLLARDGARVTLVTALGDDEAGAALGALLERSGVAVVDLGRGGATPEKVRVRAGGRVLARMDHGGPPPTVGAPSAAARRALRDAGAVLVSDYGRGITAAPGLRAELAGRACPLVWDPHPRGSMPVEGADLVTPNRQEVRGMAGDGEGAEGVEEAARRLLERARARAVAVTLGARGALLVDGPGPALSVPAPPVTGGDPCGAGDRLAGAAAAALAGGEDPAGAIAAGVAAASAFVAAGGAGGALAGSPAGEPAAADPVARTRAAGGRVVATGGCFDLLHAGHVAMLEAARSLGDCLVVLLNSDASVRRLKGPDRPLVHQDDRAAVLSALRCVDAVVVFDEDTPERALAELAPDVFAKGADYAPEDLPEAATVRRLGGEVVTLPYVAGRSTTRLIEEVALRAAR
jgi:rfaE bifunctional protein nucleotidyltransferase chain/domain/rfaE bifunctional protein kinase chain/domain